MSHARTTTDPSLAIPAAPCRPRPVAPPRRRPLQVRPGWRAALEEAMLAGIVGLSVSWALGELALWLGGH